VEKELLQTDRTDDWEHLRKMADSKKRLEEKILSLYAALEQLEANPPD